MGLRAGLLLGTPILAALLGPSLLAGGAGAAESWVPEGFTVAGRATVAAGVEHLHLVRAEPPLSVHVARLSPDAEAELRAVLSNDTVAGEGSRLERTSSMCLRAHCVLGLNADFADIDTHEPLGGLVADGQLLRTPSKTHHQVSITEAGELVSGAFEWTGTLVPTDLEPMKLGGVNISRATQEVVLFTPAWGPATEGGDGQASLVLKTVEPAGPLRLGQTALVEVSALSTDPGGLAIPADGGVLSATGKGAGALRGLWDRIQSGVASPKVLLRLDTPNGIVESVGGSPILVRDGKRWFTDPGDNFTRGRHPRTVVGWDQHGTTLLVTIDGRQPESVGATLAEAADLMVDLGATEAVNLDGGGSTTFVAQGAVVNQPSDVAVRGEASIRHVARPGDIVLGRVERPVASGLMVVPSTEVPVPHVDPLAGPSLGLPQAMALRAASSTDPGSVPDGDLPALVTEETSPVLTGIGVVAVAADAAAGVGLALALRQRFNRRAPRFA